MRLRIFLASLLCLVAGNAFSAELWRPGGEPAFVDENGDPYAGGNLFFFDAGGTNPRTVYQDADETIPWSSPVPLDSAGRLSAPIYIDGDTDFKEVFKNSSGTTIYSFDDIQIVTGGSSGGGGSSVLNTPVVSKSSNYTILTADAGTFFVGNATGGTLSFTLPAAGTVGDGATFIFQKTDATTNGVVINPTGGELIDNAASVTIDVQFKSVYLVSDGSGWHVQGPGAASAIVTADIADDAITNAKMADDSVASAEIDDGTVASADLRDSTALSVIGRSANSSGVPADITCSAASDGVIRESASTLGCGTIATAGYGDLTVTFGKIASSAYDTDATLAANSDSVLPTQKAVKTYIDAVVTSSVKWKDPVRVATTAAVTLASDFENGDTIDGVVLATGDRILVKNQASAIDNGIYTVNASGTPTRSTDADANSEVPGATVFVTAGTANGSSQWTCTNTSVTLGVTSITFSQIASGTVYIADGTTLQLSGTTFSVKNDGIGAAQIATGAVGTLEISDASVALADMANIASDRLIGRDTASSGVPEALTVAGGLEFTGSGGIQRSALTGDVSASAGSGTTAIGNDKVTAAMIATDAVGTAEIATDGVAASEINADAVGVSEIAANSVGNSEMLDDAVGNAEMANNAIGNTEMADNAIGLAEMADSAVGATEIVDGSITTTDMASSAYTEGSWTPSLAFGGSTTGVTYTTQVGRYIRVGNMVTLWCSIVLTSNGSGSGSATISGLPFTASTVSGLQFVSGAFRYANGSSLEDVLGIIASAGTTIQLFKVNVTPSSTSAMSETHIDNDFEASFSITYRIN